ncbi:Sodium/hydrogen exchanger family-domain-containing protein [Massariosphaeria phaeospora]|uniref:Sodium/hydrogen exchanger family-domain-containing protein n=1 Tax=Massariosphaeria phaeospora TaxID=100035 RepID=A0A7C8IN24_9PLEO|nr:Sodium/hydrogen exchanger family-domain-containing protein [Massariosphaeria phaeospora]
MPTLAVNNFNIVCATLGGFITLFGLISYLIKERFYLSEALISLISGLIFSPHAANLIRPEEYALGDAHTLGTITLFFSRLVLGVQLVIAGIQLPSKYLLKEWKSLAYLLGPGMVAMWMCTSLLVFAFVPHISFLHALAVGACVTPTDPVLSNSIVKGKFADKNIPRELQKIIVAESGANDGLGYPFLFLPLYLIKYTGHGGLSADGNVRTAIGLWFGETWGYVIILSIIYGAAVGWLAKELLHWAEGRKYVDKESFLVFAITLALFIVGTVGMIGSDDVLACFIAGNVFTWDDWFRLETMDDSFQPTIDMLLNVSIFIWFGAVCPWVEFVHNKVIPIYRLIFLGILVLLLRRPPIIFAMHKRIHQIEQKRQAIYVGFFGPIGVSSIFYLYITLEFLEQIKVDGEVRPDAEYLMEVTNVVVWFLCICSIVIHGLTIPMTKLGVYLPRTISGVISTARDDRDAFHVEDTENPRDNEQLPRTASGNVISNSTSISILPNVRRIGRTIIRAHDSKANSQVSVSLPQTPSQTPHSGSKAGLSTTRNSQEDVEMTSATEPSQATQPAAMVQRTIRFPDEAHPSSDSTGQLPPTTSNVSKIDVDTG